MTKSPNSTSSFDANGTSRRLSPEVRRARHRERMQRQRLAQKKSIEVKRVEVQQLTCELAQVTKRLSNELQSRQVGKLEQSVETFASLKEEDRDSFEDGDTTSRKLWNHHMNAPRLLQGRYLSLVLQQEEITDENRRLRERFQEWEKFMKVLGMERERLPKRTIKSDELFVQEEGRGCWVVFSQEEPAMFYQPIARNTAYELAFKGYQRMQQVLRGPGARTLYNEAFGWKVYFSMHKDDELDTRKIRMQHRFTKRISAIDAKGVRITSDTLATRTWKIISTPELYTQMYRSPMTSKMLQHVDAHLKVLMRTFPDENAVMRLRFVCLVVQVQDYVVDQASDMIDVKRKNKVRRRVTILSSLLDPEICFPRGSIRTSDSVAEWMHEGMSYLSFTDIDDGDSIEIEYGGLMNVANETASCTGLPFVAMNMGEALVRWEQQVTSIRTLSITEA